MINRKIITILLLMSLIASLHCERLITPIKMTLQNGETKSAKILCLGKKGLIVWLSNMPYHSDLLDEYAEYIPYQGIDKIKIESNIDFVPIGIGLSGAAIMSIIGVSSGNAIAIFGAVLAGAISLSIGVFGLIASLFIPKYRSPNSFIIDYKLKIPYVRFIKDVPQELKTMLSIYEK